MPQTMTRPTSTRSTTSRRSASRPEPFTVDHFRAYARMLVLDNGSHWDPEDFQLDVARDFLAGVQNVWMVVPEGNGKTTLMGGLALYHADYTPAANVLLAAASREQCEGLLMQAAWFVYNTPGLDAKSNPAKGRFVVQEGHRRILAKRTNGRIQVRAADDRTGDGVIPTACFVDELHQHRNLALFRTWRGKLQKRGGQICVISTAGEPGHEFEEAREQMRRHADERVEDGAYTCARGSDWVLHDFRLPEGDDPLDLAAVAAANPYSGVTPAVLDAKGPDAPGFDLAHWLRVVCNRPTTASGTGLSPEEWDALEDPGLRVDHNLPGVIWLDVAWQIDTTAMGVLLWESLERRVIAGVRVLRPPVDESSVVDGLLDLAERFPNARRVILDPSAGATQMVQQLEKGEHPLQVARGAGPLDYWGHSQDNAPMSQAAVRFDEAVRNGWIVHDGDRTLRAHVLNGVRKPTGPEKYRYDRPADAKGERRAKYPIDALTGVLMGNNWLVDNETPVATPWFEALA